MIISVNEKVVFVIHWDKKLPISNWGEVFAKEKKSNAKLKFTESRFLTKGYQGHVDQHEGDRASRITSYLCNGLDKHLKHQFHT